VREALAGLDRYTILRELGRGGIGRVYLAYDAKLRRIVALKAMRTEGPEDRARYEREVEIAARLQHRSIAAIYDTHVVGDLFVIAMQFVDGRPLGAEPLALRDALAAVAEAARAVQHAHDQGVIHRDLKPDNLLRSRDGRVFVLDFGLARRIERDAQLTRTGSITGTPAFMSPEQARGRAMDERTDVYSLGATLYAVVLGRPPFEEDSVLETVQRVVAADPPAPRKVNPRLHRDVETILLKALRKAPAQRYVRAADLAADLERFLAGEPIEARPLPAPLRLLHRLRRRPWVAATVLAVLLGLAVSGGILIRQRAQDTLLRQASMTLDEASRKLDEWDRLIYLPPRDLTLHHALLEDALRLARGARSRTARRLPLAAVFEARALMRLRRESEAEDLLDEWLRSGGDGRLHLTRAQVRLQLLNRRLMDPSRLVAANWAMFAGNPVRALQEAALREALEAILADLNEARLRGGDVGFEADYLAAVEPAFRGDFARAEEASRSLLQRSSPWEQAELLRLLAWAQYFQFLKEAPNFDVSGDLAPSPYLRAAREHIGRALEVRRSDADFHLFRAFLSDLEATQLLSALQALPVVDFPRNCELLRSGFVEHGARITREQREALARASSDLDTALAIRPGDPDALLLRASVLFGSIRLDDWLTINAPTEVPLAVRRGVGELIRRVIRESIDPAEAACKDLLQAAPDNALAWLHLALFRWQRGNMLRLTGNLDAYMPAIEAATRALTLAQEPPAEAFLHFMRGMAWAMLYRAHRRADPSERTAALADQEKVRKVSPELAEVIRWVLEGN